MKKRRKFSAEFKAHVVLELISGEKGLMQASREYEIKDSVLSRWKQEFVERAPQLFEQAQARIAAALAAGGRMVRDEFAPSWWTQADAAGNEADIATTKGRD